MAEGIALRVEHVSKDFVLPHEKITSVKGLFTSLIKRRLKTKEVQHALHDVSFEVMKGEFFGIVGRNGSGKSTMLKMLAGIYQPTKGRVTVKGRLVPFIELGVGFNAELTGRENVYLNGAMMGFSKKETDTMYDDIVAFAELKDFMDQKLRNYSSGMQVRLAFSVAIRANAEILLIDEVLAVGDAAFQQKCLDYFRQLKKNHKTVVFVSHDMDAIRQFCDRAVMIEKSDIVEIGSPDKIAERYSRMFAREAEQAAKDRPVRYKPGERRWGSQLLHIEHPTISDKVVTAATEYIEFGAILHAQEDVESPVIGFRITDAAGKPITGTNSMLLHQKTPFYKAGARVPFVWRVPNIFSNGRYEVSLAIIEENNNSIDVWNGVLDFEVVKAMKTPYMVAPKLELLVGKDEK